MLFIFTLHIAIVIDFSLFMIILRFENAGIISLESINSLPGVLDCEDIWFPLTQSRV